MRVAAAGDEIGDGDAVGGDRRLGQQAEPARDVLGGPVRDLTPVEHHLPRTGREQTRQGPEQGRFAASVGADDDGERAIGDGERKIGRDRAGVVAQRHAVGLQAVRHRSCSAAIPLARNGIVAGVERPGASRVRSRIRTGPASDVPGGSVRSRMIRRYKGTGVLLMNSKELILR